MTSPSPNELRLPPSLLPADGRFGSGPSKVRPEALGALAATGASLLGTSHRRPPVRQLVARIRAGLAELWDLPAGYEVVLGNGGATLFWDLACCSLIGARSQHLVFGEFSAGFAAAVAGTPHLEAPEVRHAEVGSRPEAAAAAGVDLYALTHNETSTGVRLDLRRPPGADPSALVAVDATSAAGALRFDPAQVDVYYFSPQKAFASEGGLWVAVLSPAAVERVATLASSGRWVPASLDLGRALEQSRQDQTLNTPSVSTLFLLVHQLDWMLERGGLDFAVRRCEESAQILYRWAEDRPYTAPFVTDPSARSPVVGTVDLDPDVPAGTVSAVLRANGIVDTESYRKLGRNQLRIGMFPAVDPADVAALTACVDWVAERI